MNPFLETIAQIAERNPGLTEAAIRGYVRNREINGLAEAGAITKRGRRVFLIQPYFDNWLLGTPTPAESRRRIEEHQERQREQRRVVI